ncbi:unnamed protein product [Durusdinium trenchii]|uniref:Uncharacterized protein n=1 Tax=Durusdinium trenchii TaxID=1381693 RepID=A0ABP0QB08_9DINO
MKIYRPPTDKRLNTPIQTVQVEGVDPRSGRCSVPIPNAFSCKDLDVWRTFLELFQANAQQGFPVDGELFDIADWLVVQFQTKPFEAHPPEGFFNYLCGGSDEKWPLPNQFCLMGYVAALFVRARHLMAMGAAGDADAMTSANADLSYIEPILGKEISLDYLDSSPWPISILDVFLNINQTEFMTYEQYAAKHPVRAHAVPLESIHWQPPGDIVQRLSGAVPAEMAVPAEIAVAVFGTHATLSLEPVDMLGRAQRRFKIKATFFGIEPRWCELLGLCDLGASEVTQLLRKAEEDPFAYPWEMMSQHLTQVPLARYALLLCTEPVAGCLMLRRLSLQMGQPLPMLGYFGVALLNGCPPQDVPTFWQHWGELFAESPSRAVLATNNLILSEQIFYQTGRRLPYVRAQGLYTEVVYSPQLVDQILFWRSPLFAYATLRCAIARFLEGLPQYPLNFYFLQGSESVPYKKAVSFRAAALLPQDHALMSFYELYSANLPLLLPSAEWMYRLLYMRGQLSVGERWYQAIMPNHEPPFCEFEDAESGAAESGAPTPQWGLSAAKAARSAAVQTLRRIVTAPDLATAQSMAEATLGLMEDQKYFLMVAANETDQDSATSMGVVRRAHHGDGSAQPSMSRVKGGQPWHPYTPFQMSTRDSNDWTRMRKGGWWLRRGFRFDAMRYWHQFSDFARFPGLQYFANIPELLCRAQSMDIPSITQAMQSHNQATFAHSAAFWANAALDLLR